MRLSGAYQALTDDPLARTKLTPAFCRDATAETGKERSVYWDESMQGFGLVVTSSGSRSWCVQQKSAGRSRRMSWPYRSMLLDEARRQARALLLMLGGVGLSGTGC